jgi:hypothetical protein
MIRMMKRAAYFLSIYAVVLFALSAGAQKKKTDNLQKPMAGPRATILRITWLYVAADLTSQKVGRVQIGREMVVAEHSGTWMRVYANTDIQLEHESPDTPLIGSPDSVPPPVSGWIEAKGVVLDNTPGGDQILMGEATNEESLASDPRGPANAAKSARLLYRRVVEMFPNSPLAPEAAWRAADIQWQIQKADSASRPSARERDSYLREQMDEDEMKKILKFYPRTRQATLAAFELLDNKFCGDWQGQEKCPEKESELYEKYASEFPDGPRTAEALYEATYREAVLVDMFSVDGNDNKANAAKGRAHDLAGRLKDKFPQTDYAGRAAALIFRIDQGIPVYGIEHE